MLPAFDQTLAPEARLNTETLQDRGVRASKGTLGLSSILQLRAYVCYYPHGGIPWLTMWPGLVLFYCTFIALRSEDGENSVGFYDDQEIHGEKSIYAG